MDTQTQALHFYKNHGFKKSSNKLLEFKLMHEERRGMYLFFKILE
jgi:predicted GNAT family N-acyltransferase